jgi:hypothetical protein
MTTTHTPVPEPFAAIAAFLDGERVDTAALKHALSTDEGRDYLVDVLALRQSAIEMEPVAFPIPPAAQRRRLAGVTAAAIAIVASAFGYVVGGQTDPIGRSSASVSSVEAVVDVSMPPQAPEPTEIVRLLSGVNWTTSGEN